MADGHCHVCDAIVEDPPEKVLYRGEHWYAGAVSNTVGWIRFQTTRHGTDWSWGMTDVEAAEFGPLVRRLSAAVKDSTGCDKVYTVGFGDNSMHFHMLLMPFWDSMPADYRGGGVIRHNADLQDPVEAPKINDAIRAYLAAS